MDMEVVARVLRDTEGNTEGGCWGCVVVAVVHERYMRPMCVVYFCNPR